MECKKCKKLFIAAIVIVVLNSIFGTFLGFHYGVESGRLQMTKSIAPVFLELDERIERLQASIRQLEERKGLTNPWE